MNTNSQKSPNSKTSQKTFSQHSYDKYSDEMKNQYMAKEQTHKLDKPFIAMHSDYLNLQIKQDGSVWSRNKFHDGDTILQIRGSIVRVQALKYNLRSLGKDQNIYDGCYGTLLWLNFQPGILLKPKGISNNIISSSLLSYRNKVEKSTKLVGNCYIQSHLGSKLLIKAKQIIPKQQKLILQQNSVNEYLYK